MSPAAAALPYRPFPLRRERTFGVLRRLIGAVSQRRRGAVIALSDIAPPEATDALVAKIIREVWAKGYGTAEIHLADVDLEGVRPLTRSLDKGRYDRAGEHLWLLRRNRLRPFVPVLLRFGQEKAYRLALPPVLELHGVDLVVVDGAHRLKALADAGAKRAVCVVVAGQDLPRLPGEPADNWDDVEVFKWERSAQKKIQGIRRRSFRPTGRMLKGERFVYESVEDLRRECVEALTESRSELLRIRHSA